MDLYEQSCRLSAIVSANRSVFIKTEPEIPDFTKRNAFKLIVYGQNDKVEFEVNGQNIMHIVGLFDATVFDSTQVNYVYGWNLKALASYFYYHSHKYLSPKTVIIDLKIIESFLGIRGNVPTSLNEAIRRTNTASKQKSWQSIYKKIHLPLAFQVLPAIETVGLLNSESKICEHPYYEIEGQVNGRMNCAKAFSHGFLAHNLGPDAKKALKPKGYGQRFLCSDFKHCEVTVLQWLSKDPVLEELINSGKDLHARIYELVTGDKCDSVSKRTKSKRMFLPVMYGCGAGGLAKNLEVPEGVALELINRIKKEFAVSTEWMKEQQEKAKNGPYIDYFGRVRTYASERAYEARNLAVQGVAAVACQERLIELHKAINGSNVSIVFSVHDGYGLTCPTSEAKDTYQLVKKITESESNICSGLKMRVEIKFGAKLDALKILWRD